MHTQAPKPKPVAKPPAPKAPPKAKAAAKPKAKPAPKPKKREAWETDEDEESDGFVGSDSDGDNFASSAPVAPRAKSGRSAATKKTYQFDSDDDDAEDDDGDFPMTQETVEAPRPAPMEESDEEFVRAGVVTSARRRDGPVPYAATVASRAGVRGGQGRAAQAGAEAEEGRRAAQGSGQEAAGQEKAERLEL